MLFKNLRYFVALSQERHFGRAAESCGVSQPALSSAIKQLENELSVPLVKRGQRFIGFTTEGERVLGWSERILADLDSMKQEISKLRDGLEGRLRLAVVPTALTVLPHITAPFAANHPSVDISITSMSSKDIQKGLDNFEIDMGITYLDNEPLKRVKSQKIYTETYALMVPKSSDLYHKTSVSWGEAALLSLCLLSRDMQNRRIIDTVFSELGLEVKPSIEMNSIASLVPQVETGQWSAIVPKHIVFGTTLPETVALIDLREPYISYEVGTIVSDQEPQSPTAKAMLEVINQLKINDLFKNSL